MNKPTKKDFDDYAKVIAHALETGDYSIVNCGLHDNHENNNQKENKK